MKKRKQMSQEEATRSPIFLLQRRIRGDYYETESVWYSREEAEQYLKDHAYNYRNSKPGFPGGRVYCVPCNGELSNMLDTVSEQDDRIDLMMVAIKDQQAYWNGVVVSQQEKIADQAETMSRLYDEVSVKFQLMAYAEGFAQPGQCPPDKVMDFIYDQSSGLYHAMLAARPATKPLET